MCAIYCWVCKDAGTKRTWGGDVECICVRPCETCGGDKTTARHRHYCRPWPEVQPSAEADNDARGSAPVPPSAAKEIEPNQ